jgi:polyhydroxyalkanoate synthesis regulator phasin
MDTAKPPPILRVPSTTTDKQLTEALEKVLPDLLVKKMNISRDQAEKAAQELANQIVYTARQCNETHLINDVSKKINISAPSKEECDDFKKAVDEIIRIQYVEKIHTKGFGDAFKYTTGKLWFYLRHRVLGLPQEPQFPVYNAVIGDRG